MAVAGKHAAPAGHQREHMARTAQVLRPGGRIHAHPAGEATLLGGDAGGGLDVVDGDGEGSLMVVGVDLHHLLQLEPVGQLLTHGGADKALGMHGHKIDVLCGGKLGGADHVSLIFPVRVVDGDDDAARPQFLQRLFDCTEQFFHN